MPGIGMRQGHHEIANSVGDGLRFENSRGIRQNPENSSRISAGHNVRYIKATARAVDHLIRMKRWVTGQKKLGVGLIGRPFSHGLKSIVPQNSVMDEVRLCIGDKSMIEIIRRERRAAINDAAADVLPGVRNNRRKTG